MEDLPPPIPAATLVLMRPVGEGPPQILMMERPGHMAFAAGALVFPGGRIDPQDGLGEVAAKVAAIRETLEETGLAVGLLPLPDTGQALCLRDGLLRGRHFANLLADADFTLELDRLTSFARWCPNFRETRRFDTIFFLAEAPPDAPEPVPQPGEATRAFWASAAEVLGELDTGAAHAIFPTRRNLERLARFASFEEARADAETYSERTIIPWVEVREGRDWVCIPEDLGYPVTAELLETARRR